MSNKAFYAIPYGKFNAQLVKRWECEKFLLAKKRGLKI